MTGCGFNNLGSIPDTGTVSRMLLGPTNPVIQLLPGG